METKNSLNKILWEKEIDPKTIEHCITEFFKELLHTEGPWISHPYFEAVNGPNKRICLLVSQGGSLRPQDKENCKLISRSPDLLRSVCNTYLTLLVKFKFGQNEFCNSVHISLDSTFASLRNEISLATGLECQYIQDKFEAYVNEIGN